MRLRRWQQPSLSAVMWGLKGPPSDPTHRKRSVRDCLDAWVGEPRLSVGAKAVGLDTMKRVTHERGRYRTAEVA